MPAQVSIDLLAWVKAEIDHALRLARESIAGYSARGQDAALLRACPEHLHQVQGALRMVGLQGATLFCEALETSFSHALHEPVMAKATVPVLDRAIYALGRFLDGLSKGDANLPLKLLPAYREVAALHGRRHVDEKELFFPNLAIEPPLNPAAKTLDESELSAYLHAQRSRYQRGMVAWVRNPGEPHGTHEMVAALDAIDRVARQLPSPHGLWWAACGLIDGLAQSHDSAWNATAKPLCSRIDGCLRDITAGRTGSGDEVLRLVLYAIARCPVTSPRMRTVGQTFRLDSQFPEAAVPGLVEFDLGRLQPALDDLRSRLEAGKGFWVQYTSGERAAHARFCELAATIRNKADELGNASLTRLFDTVSAIATRLPDPYPADRQVLLVEMAAAFLLADHILDTFTTPLPDLEQQVALLTRWLAEANKGRTVPGEPPVGLRADLTQRISDIQLRAQVAKEIAANLQVIEQVLDNFARDAGARDALPALKPLLAQVHGALVMLRFQRADELLAFCAKLIDECAGTDGNRSSGGMDALAEGLSRLGMFLQPMLHGREPAGHFVENFLERELERKPRLAHTSITVVEPGAWRAGPLAAIEPLVAVVPAGDAVAAPAQPPVTRADSPGAHADGATISRRVSTELLGIFLEEAREVLEQIAVELPVCRNESAGLQPLHVIRRGFHTIKGSGRMVGLVGLGEVAWQLEQVLNRQLEAQSPPDAALADLIAQAHRAFTAWIEQLKTRTPAAEHCREIVELAQNLKSYGAVSAPSAVEEVPAVAVANGSAIAADASPREALYGREPADGATHRVCEPVAAHIGSASPPPSPATAAPASDVIIGSVRMSRAFYDIYLKEALQHLDTLERDFSEWQRAGGGTPVSHEFMRAAHTVAGISRTTGFSGVADLASALEQWLPYAPRTLLSAPIATVRNAIDGLREMIAGIERLAEPAPSSPHALALRAVVTALAPMQNRPEDSPDTHGADASSTAHPTAPDRNGEAYVLGRATAPAHQAAITDDLDRQVLPVFLEETRELLPALGQALQEWKAAPTDYQPCHALQRLLHTLKGSARMAGAMRVGEFAHHMESTVDGASRAEPIPASLFAGLENELDRLNAGIELLVAAAAAPAPSAAAAAAAQPAVALKAPLAGHSATLRISTDTLDRLVNEAGEISIARSRLEAEVRGVKQSAAELGESALRLRTQLREVEIQADSQMQSRRSVIDERDHSYDPLELDRYTRLQELTRMMSESLHDIEAVQQNLTRTAGDAEAALMHQSRINRDLQTDLMRMRTVPFAALGERLYRTVRRSARELGKKANLEIVGGQCELDRSLLDKIAPALEHMLRNAVVHGIENAEVRAALNKPAMGEIRIDVRQEGNEIVLVVQDDGGGIDCSGLRCKAVEKGLIADARELAEDEMLDLMFERGLSIVDVVTELSGRGVGMDVVKSEVTALGGRINVKTEASAGSSFTLALPLTLAVTQAVLVRARGALYAIPAAMVEQVLKLRDPAIVDAYGTGSITARGGVYPLAYLGALVDQEPRPDALAGHNAVLLLRSGERRMALHADELVRNQEIVVKSIGPQLARMPGIAGATVLGDGAIVLIINPLQLAPHRRPGTAPNVRPMRVAQAEAAAPMIMIVDDSLTVRKITSKLLEREGYRTLTAKDGVDALEKLQDGVPAAMLVDIEMPRMDGFELSRKIRGDSRIAGVPIIIISSRTAERHRNEALELGIAAFLGKPYQEGELLSQLRLALLSAQEKTAALH